MVYLLYNLLLGKFGNSTLRKLSKLVKLFFNDLNWLERKLIIACFVFCFGFQDFRMCDKY